jgi:hypothetical protein
MRSNLYKSLALFISLALCMSVATWLRSWRELQAETAANVLLRKTLGELTVAIAAKDREIDRMTKSSCDSNKK